MPKTGGLSYLAGKIDIHGVLADLFSTNKKYIPETLIDHATNALSLGSTTSYLVRNFRGMDPHIHSREVFLKDHKMVYAKLSYFMDNYYLEENEEREEICLYLQGKGSYAEVNDNLIMGLINQLTKEKGKEATKYLTGYQSISLSVVSFGDILNITEGPYGLIKPLEPVSPFPEAMPICGILSQHENGYQLLDGQHRVKYEIINGEDAGSFIILA